MNSNGKKEALVVILEEISHYLKILGENDFKVRAYEKGAAVLQKTDVALEKIASGSEKVAGIGEGLRTAIGEFLKDGKVALHEECVRKIPEAVLNLMQVPGLGPRKAMQIHEELGIGTVGELEYACRENRLVTLKGFGSAAQKKILSSIEEMKAFAGKLRLSEARLLGHELLQRLEKESGGKAELVGEAGRFLEICSKLSFWLHSTDKGSSEKAIQKVFGSMGNVAEETLPGGKAYCWKIPALSKEVSVAVEIWWAKESEDARRWLCADPLVRTRLEKEKSKFEGWESTWLESEWVGKRHPSAETYRQSRDGHVRGVFHCHTNASDGGASLEDMVLTAEKLGYEYIGISDHSKSAFYAHGLDVDRLHEQRQAIDALQKKVKIRIFHGVESDILADGALDYDDKTLSSFDFIVGSIHSRFQMDEKEMTKRIVQALSHPRITFWGHPTGRLLLARKPYALDWNQCLKAAADHGVVVELNANSHRLDIDWRLGAELEKRKIKICVNPDAHSTEGLTDTLLGEKMAEKAMVPRTSVLNLLPVVQMEEYLWDRKKKHSRP